MPPDFSAMGLAFCAGLAAFLLGVNFLSENLKAAAGDGMKRWIARFTTNRFAGVLSGVVATALLDSSSAVAIIAVGLVHARAMTFPQALGVVMGANVGTTVSSQIYATGVAEYGQVLTLPGLLLHWLGRSDKWKHVGGVAFGLGLVFFGLHHIETAAKPLEGYEPFRQFMTRMENPLLGVFAGAVATAVIQSSSAMMGILIILVGQGVSLPAAAAMMMGAEVGTCLDVLVAAAGRSREAVRVGVFQMGFNVASVALFVAFTGPLVSLATTIAGDDPKRVLATAHVLFNVAGVLVFIGLTDTMAKLVLRLVPNKPGDGDGGDKPEEPGG